MSRRAGVLRAGERWPPERNLRRPLSLVRGGPMKRAITLLLAAAVLVAPAGVRAEEGSAGLAFLKLGVGARAIGVGDAYVAVGGDASSIYWNPAGTVDVENLDFVLMHSEWFQGIRYDFAGGVNSDGKRAYGAAITGLYMDDLERRVGPTAEPEGHFGVFDFAITGTYAQRLTEHLAVGAGLKYLSEKIDDEVASSYAADLGATYRIPAIPGLTTGLAIQNLGPQMKFIEEEFDLPVTYRLGGALATSIEGWNSTLLVTGDAVLLHHGDNKTHFGLELEYASMIALRFGYRSGWDNHNVSVGMGAKVRNFRLDYAYVPFYSDLGDTHRMSLGFTL